MTDLIPTHFTVIRPEHGRWEDTTQLVVEWPREPGYDAIAKVVKPLVMGDLEHVGVLDTQWPTAEKKEPTYVPADMFVNDMGALNDKIPINPLATFIYHTFSRVRGSGRVWASAPPIFGPAVLFKRRVWF